jgi:hypothetical protein
MLTRLKIDVISLHRLHKAATRTYFGDGHCEYDLNHRADFGAKSRNTRLTLGNSTDFQYIVVVTHSPHARIHTLHCFGLRPKLLRNLGIVRDAKAITVDPNPR